MIPRIETLKEKLLIGKKIVMSFTDNKTPELWKSFMPRRKEIENSISLELFSIEVYKPNYFDSFNPNTEFEKWAAVEVTDWKTIPKNMDIIKFPAGLYAVFVHKGPDSDAPKTYGYIFTAWLPHSEYLLDDRPHFALMGEKYKYEDINSEEEIWIPIKPKI
jgi:AraC family transcriptional regulator